jgi:hypothetical protein
MDGGLYGVCNQSMRRIGDWRLEIGDWIAIELVVGGFVSCEKEHPANSLLTEEHHEATPLQGLFLRVPYEYGGTIYSTIYIYRHI